jgi:glycosyltransferase involved in cell wall biosynthesis/protein-tyrosine-phosphatase
MISVAERTPAIDRHPGGSPPEIRVCHVMSADLWAGAEVQLATTASFLVHQAGIQLTAVLLNEGRLAYELRAFGIEVAVVDERRHGSAAIVAFLLQFLRTHRIDIVHTHRYKDTVLGAIAAKLAGTPKFVRTVHGRPEPLRGWDRLKFEAYGALERSTLGWCADRIVAVSNDLADTLLRSGYRHSAIVPIHNGINFYDARARRDRRLVRRDLRIAEDARVVGTIGRLAPVKAHRDLLRAAQRILARTPEATFLIVGDGPLRHELEAEAARLGVAHACRFTGPRQDIYDLLSAMDVFVLPSLHEGVPMALLEAMALGKPVVATAVGGVPEIVRDRVTGRLVPARNDRALANACLDLISDLRLAHGLGLAAQRAVAERFSHQVSGGTLLDVYRSLVSTQRIVPQRTNAADLGVAGLAWELTRGLIRIARRRTARAMDHRAARRLMHRIRKNPGRLTKALGAAKQILIVCHGNVIRSAFAGELLSRRLAGAPVRIVSGGVAAVAGNPPHPTALRLAVAHAVDLTRHAASPLEPSTIAASDVIFVMDIPLLIAMRQRFPEARERVFLLTCLNAHVPLEIRDPIDGDESRFQACFDHICEAVQPIVAALGQIAWAR